jgi:hypothetical protein
LGRRLLQCSYGVGRFSLRTGFGCKGDRRHERQKNPIHQHIYEMPPFAYILRFGNERARSKTLGGSLWEL